MPTYEYACSACGHAYEVFEGIKSKPNTKCPKCKKAKAERIISGGAGIIFKGSGFYSTDYRSGKYKESAKKESTATKADAPCSTCGDPKGPGACATEKPAKKGTSKPAKAS